MIFSNNSITVCGNVELIEPYSCPNTISRLCKKEITTNPNVAKMLPPEFISVTNVGFTVKEPEGLEFFINQIHKCLTLS